MVVTVVVAVMVVAVVVVAMVVMVVVVVSLGRGVGAAPLCKEVAGGALPLTAAGVGVESLNGFRELRQFLHESVHVVVRSPQSFFRQWRVQVLFCSNVEVKPCQAFLLLSYGLHLPEPRVLPKSPQTAGLEVLHELQESLLNLPHICHICQEGVMLNRAVHLPGIHTRPVPQPRPHP